MVNNSTRKQPSGSPSDTERKIHDGPCHDLSKLQALVRQNGHKAVRVVTEKGTAEMIGYCMDEQDLAELVLKLRAQNYHDSEWCRFSESSPWFEADSYRIVVSEKLASSRDLQRCKYYLKFALNKLGVVLLFFSVHRDTL